MTQASCLLFLKPVMAAILAMVILVDEPTLSQGLAIIVVTGLMAVEIFWLRIAVTARCA